MVVAAAPLVVFAVPALAADEADWTFAVYVAADNDLESSWDGVNVPALLRVPASADVHIVALVDRLSTTTVELIEFEGDQATVVEVFDEVNSGDGATFEWFLGLVAARYPAEHLAVTMWDHGGGWKYICADDSSDGDRITMGELHAALDGAAVPIDILAFDACNMADVAVAYELALTGLVDLMVASEEMIPLDGFGYDHMLTPLAADPTLTPEELAQDMVDGWGLYYDPLAWAKTVCLSAVDVHAVGEARAALQTWVRRLGDGLPRYAKDYSLALTKTWRAKAGRQYDLLGLCGELAADPDLKRSGIRPASLAVAKAIEKAVLARHTTAWTAEATGLTVWWANIGEWKYFEAAFGDDVAFAEDAPVGIGWYDLLLAYTGD
jgi:hypothetical protein